ncbi:uncharacterized protein [Clytia hemisphaerica]|uniref:uncharacterized protein n=1 Tax=Clytia hemisphaerica TaxID=252671 RepID=UPI0034D7A2C6
MADPMHSIRQSAIRPPTFIYPWIKLYLPSLIEILFELVPVKKPLHYSETYEDIIEAAKRKWDDDRHEFDTQLIKNACERRKFSQKRALDVLKYKIRSGALLSNPKEVRMLSELLRPPDHREPPEEATVRAAKLRNVMTQTFGEEDESAKTKT